MNPVKVKICGIVTKRDLRASVKAGADALGFVVDVPDSPRNLSINKAEKLMKETPIFCQRVVVTVAKDIESIVKICKRLRPEAVQVHGCDIDDWRLKKSLCDIRIIRSVPASSNNVINEAVSASRIFDAVHIDSYVKGKFGGTGVTHNWRLSKLVRDAVHPKPLILAGGLNPENVVEAIKIVRPYAVDVSSGVECETGVKDPKKITNFICKVRSV